MYEKILVYKISYKTFIDAKPLGIRSDKIDRFIKICDETRYLVLFGAEKYDFIYNEIRNLIGVRFMQRIMQRSKLFHTILCPYKKHRLCIMLQYSLRQFLIKIEITTTTINFSEKVSYQLLKNNDNEYVFV